MRSNVSSLTKGRLLAVSKGLVISSQAFLLFACINDTSGTGLFKKSGSENTARSETLAAPTKNDVALVNGTRFSISGYQQIKTQLKKPTQEVVFWVGVASILFQEDAKARSLSLTLAQAISLARFSWGDLTETPSDPIIIQYLKALSPDSPRAMADRLISRSIVQRNPQVLAELQ